MSSSRKSPIIVALDFPSAKEAIAFSQQLNPSLCRLKVGFELYVASGPVFVEQLVAMGFDVFLDLKFHDIPNTVASACRVAAKLGVWMMNVHASGGVEMMLAAKEALAQEAHSPKLIAVTVLTSMNQEQLNQTGVAGAPDQQVIKLATLSSQVGLDGVVCSALEAESLRSLLGKDFLLVTPGIRPLNAAVDDQSRIVTPVQAMKNGSSFLVIGRPITRADEPLKVLEQMNAELSTSIGR